MAYQRRNPVGDREQNPMKPINAFPYIAMLVIVIALILMFGGYFQ